MKYREQATVLNIEEIGKEIFSLVLQTRQIAMIPHLSIGYLAK